MVTNTTHTATGTTPSHTTGRILMLKRRNGRLVRERSMGCKRTWTFSFFAVAASLMAVEGRVSAQTTTTVFQDTFTSGNSATWTTSGTIGTSLWSVTRSGDDWGARINNTQLELTNDVGATGNVNGWVYASTPTSGFTSPWSSTLSSNPGLVTWEFNMRQIRSDPAGFGAGSYGAAFVLGGNSTTVATSGTGYAIVLGQSGATDPIRLATFAGGLQGTLTNVITGTGVFADIGAEYLSVRVTYNPTGNIWLMYGGTAASSFGDPTGTLSLTGSATNSTYTGTTLTSMGGYWQGSTAANQTAFFDNVYVKVQSAAASPGNYWAPGVGGGGTGTWTSGTTVWATSAGVLGSGSQATTGTLIFGNNAGTVTVSGSVTAVAGMQISTTGYQFTGGTIGLTGANAAANTITTDTGVSGTINSILAGSNGLTKAGAGTLTLGGANTFTGGITVSAGSLVGTTASLQGAITNNAAVTFDQNTSGTYAGAMSGAGTLTKLGSGAVTLSANSSTFAGTTTVSAGTLVANGNLGGAVGVSSGATLGGAGTLGGAVTINSGATLSPGNSPGTLTVGSLNWEQGGSYNWQLFDTTLAAGTGYDTISSAGTLTINATSGNKFNINLWTLSGTNPDTNGLANGFNGFTSGTYTLGTFGSISGFAADKFNIVTTATNGTGGFQNAFTGTFSLAQSGGALNLVYTAPVVSAWDYTATGGSWNTAGNWNPATVPSGTATLTFSGGGGTSTNNISLAQVATLTFTGSATAGYTISGSAITLGSGGIVNNSTFTQAVSAPVTLAAGASLTANTGNLTFSGTVDNAGNTLTVTGSGNTSLGVVNGAGTFAKTGSGTATLTAAVASPNVTIGAGAVLLGGSNLLADSGTVTVSGGSLDLGANTDAVSSFSISGGTLAGAGTLTASTYALTGGTVNANLGAGTLTANSGAATLNGTSGATTVSVGGGSLTTGGADKLANAAAVTLSSGSLTLGGNDTVGSFAITGGTLGGSATLTAATYALNGGTVSGNLGAGTLTAASGAATLNGTAGAGTVNVSGGSLTTGGADKLDNAAAVTLSSGSLTLGGNDTVGSFTMTGGSLGGSATLTAATYALQGGSIAGSLGNGAVTVSAGTTSLASAGRLAAASNLTVSSGQFSLGGNETVSSYTQAAGTLGGSGTLTASTYALQGGSISANLGGGAVTVSAGTTSLASAGRLAAASNLTVSSGQLSLGGNETVSSYTQSAGTLGGSGTLTASTYALQGGSISANLGGGAVTVSAGTTSLASAGRLAAASNVTVSGGQLTLGGNETVSTYSQSGGTLGGSSTLTASTYALTGGTVNALLGAGTVNVSGGTTTLGSAGRLNAASAVNVTGGQLTLGGNETVNTYTQSAGTLAGSGTLTANSYSVSGGTLLATLGNSGTVAMSGGDFLGNSGQTIDNAITIGSGGGVVFGSTQQLVGWDFSTLTGGAGNWGPSPLAATSYASGASGGGLTRGSGLGTAGSAAASAYGASNWSSGTSASDPATANSFLAFTLTGTGGSTLNLSSIDAYNWRRSSTGATTGQWQYSLDGTTFTNTGSSFSLGASTAAGGNSMTAVDLSGISALQNLSSGTVTFRVLAWGATGTAGTGYLNTVNSGTAIDFSLSGQVGTGGAAQPATASLGINTLGATTYSGPIAITGTADLTAVAGGTATFSGIISGSAGSVAKTGLGTVILSGNNTFDGTTTVSAGGLLIDGANAGLGLTTVAENAWIGGTGSLAGGLTLESGAKLVFDPATTLDVSGAVTFDNTFSLASLVSSNGGAINWGSITDGIYTLIGVTASSFSNIQNLGSTNPYDLGSGRSAYFQKGSLQLVIVPEPSSLVLAGLGVAVAGYTAWKRRRAA